MASPEYISPGQVEPPPVRQKNASSVAPGSHLWRFVAPVLLFLAGMVVGIIGFSVALLSGNADHPPVAASPSPSNSALVVQAHSAYVNQIAQQQSGSFGVPGKVKNIQITFVHAGPVLVTGDDELSLFGLSMTRHFSLQVQLFVDACKPMAHVLRANFSGVPITGFVTSFEQSINQQLQGNVSGLPSGFSYCMTSIQTEPQGATITFAAQPVA
jgi:hypothetical protein